MTEMTSRHCVALVLCVAAFACTSAAAESKNSAKPSLQTIYTLRDAAFQSKDIPGTLAPYAADVVVIGGDGAQAKGLAAQREGLSKLFASDIAFSAPETQIEEFTLGKTDHEATVKVTHRLTVSAKSGQGSPAVVEEVVRDHWVKSGAGWRITQERRLTKSTLLELCSAAVAGPAANRILGKWTGFLPSRPGTTAQMTVEFKENGTELQTIVAPRQNISTAATYVTKNNVLTETLVSGTKNGQVIQNVGQMQTFYYRVTGNTLLIRLVGATDELRFTRQPE